MSPEPFPKGTGACSGHLVDTQSDRKGLRVDPNDYWTHVGLVTVFFLAVVGPRLFSPGHTANSLTYLVGATVVIAVATLARRRGQAAAGPDAPDRRPVAEEG